MKVILMLVAIYSLIINQALKTEETVAVPEQTARIKLADKQDNKDFLEVGKKKRHDSQFLFAAHIDGVVDPSSNSVAAPAVYTETMVPERDHASSFCALPVCAKMVILGRMAR